MAFFWNDVFHKRNVMRTSCVMFPSEMMCASRVSKEHITSLCTAGAIHHCALALHHCDEVATSLKTFLRRALKNTENCAILKIIKAVVI